MSLSMDLFQIYILPISRSLFIYELLFFPIPGSLAAQLGVMNYLKSLQMSRKQQYLAICLQPPANADASLHRPSLEVKDRKAISGGRSQHLPRRVWSWITEGSFRLRFTRLIVCVRIIEYIACTAYIYNFCQCILSRCHTFCHILAKLKQFFFLCI